MKTFASFVLAGILPLAVVAQDQSKPANAAAQVISSYRILPKVGHEKAVEAALAAHAQKFHKGDQAWRVGVVMSGPDEGMYHIVEGPSTWTAVDKRGDLGDEHMKDYLENITPHVEKNSPNLYGVYDAELSTISATQWTNKVLIEHITVKPGRGSDTYDSLKKWKALSEKLGLTVVVWRLTFSGDDGYSIVFRLKEGFAEFDKSAPNFRKAAAELYGPNEFARLEKSDTENLSRDWMELVEFKPELGSK
jgi:hypothetical protein